MAEETGSEGSVEMESMKPTQEYQDVMFDPSAKRSSLPPKREQELTPEEKAAKEKEEAEKAKRTQVRKVSPVKKFFSSIRVIFIIILFVFYWVSATAVGLTLIVQTRKLCEGFDTLDMQERIQHAIGGTVAGVIAMTTRASVAAMSVGVILFPKDLTNDSNSIYPEGDVEWQLAKVLYEEQQTTTEGPGLTEYEYLPYHLIMAWDTDWNERLIYYRPCGQDGLGYCDLLPPIEAFKNYPREAGVSGDYTMQYRDKIPKVLHRIKDIKPTNCTGGFACTGFFDAPEEDGGPMIFNLFTLDMTAYAIFGASSTLDGWTFLVGANARLLSQIQANRTGLCVSAYSESEENLPEEEEKEFAVKKEKGLVLNAVDIDRTNPMIPVMKTDTGKETLRQDYYSSKKNRYTPSDRWICDPFYDHGDDDDFISKTTTYLSYSMFDLEKIQQVNDTTYMFRFDYHDPLTKKYVSIINIVVIIFCILWAITCIAVFLYFDIQFLHPLDSMRKMREDLIKTALAGLDDDGGMAKELFGDLTDDTALIQANGDEISVMLTLQDRMDALYSRVINDRTEDLNRLRRNTLNEMNALRIMNIFMRRDDESLRAVLPGLMDPNEMARHFRRTTLNVRSQKGESWLEDLADAKHTFRTLKAVLSNQIAAQYFKAFCTQRGRSSVNSFFFLMDVSWLHQIESGARDEKEDFLSAMFSDSVPGSPASMSPRSPYLCLKNSDDGMGVSSDVIVSPEASAIDLQLCQPDPNRPHHSHFAKKGGSGNPSRSSSMSGDSPQSVSPIIQEEKKDDDDKKPKVPKLPIAATKNSASAQSLPSPGGPLSPGSPGKGATQFLTTAGDGIARFIHECYFGRKSLAQHDMRHAALLGCSQIPDYLTLRDKEKISYSPTMYDNLVTAVTKKFTTEVLPQFLNSVSFQVMALSLMLTGYFDKKNNKSETPKAENTQNQEVNPDFSLDPILKGMWQAAKSGKQEKDEKADEDDDDDSSTTTTSSSDDDDDKNDKNDEKKEDEDDDDDDDDDDE